MIDCLKYVFWFSSIFILLITLGYPMFVFIVGSFLKSRVRSSDFEPYVTLIISAYNEERHIEQKLANSLSLNYPEEKLEIIVASDGSTDKTNEIVETFSDKRVHLCRFDKLGKTGVQNEAVKKATGEVLVFSDANAIYRPDAIKNLVRHFENENIGCVCGQLVYKKDSESFAGFSERIYWQYEKALKKMESRISSLIGVNGSIYALRKSDYIEIDNHLISDLVEPLELVKNGKRIIYEPEAVSEEEPSSSYKVEFERKIRILTRSIQGLLHMKCLLNPIQFGLFSIQMLVHKLLRYLIPVFLLTAAVSLVFLSHHAFYLFLFWSMTGFLTFGAIAKFSERNSFFFKLFNLAYYYVLMNYALLIAWVNVFKKKTYKTWPTIRE